MSLDVAVLGATGDVGRQVCTQLIERQVLANTARLQLVGRADGSSGRAAYGLRADLTDAYDERMPLIDIALDPRDVVADVVVAAAGRTLPADGSLGRDQLAADNVRTFRRYADALARYGRGHEVVVVVANPVELAVAVFAERLGRHRVIGMGAWLDTLRFRREIALSLGVRRQQVAGFAVGQHGDHVVPLWSTVRIHGLDAVDRAQKVQAMRGARPQASFPAQVVAAKTHLLDVAGRDIRRAFQLVEDLAPDLRSALRPWLIHGSGAKTAVATAAATVDLVTALLEGRDTLVAGQVSLDREVHDLIGVVGVPVVIGPAGWSQVILDDLPPDELQQFRAAVAAIDESLAPWGALRR
jgi:malate dehydrogenase